MNTLKKTNWSQAGIDAIVIVVSILAAFWIDATWDEHQALKEERTILTTLLTELEDLRENRANANYLPAIRESSRRLLEFGRQPKTTVSDEQLDAWLADTTWNLGRGRGFTTPALDSLTDGGNLYRISNNELRVLFTRLHQLLELQKADAHREQIFMDEQYLAYLGAHASVGQIWAADDGPPGSPEAPAYPSSGIEMSAPPKKVSHRSLLENLEFQNLLLHRILLITNLIGWGNRNIDDTLSATISAIERELEK